MSPPVPAWDCGLAPVNCVCVSVNCVKTVHGVMFPPHTITPPKDGSLTSPLLGKRKMAATEATHTSLPPKQRCVSPLLPREGARAPLLANSVIHPTQWSVTQVVNQSLCMPKVTSTRAHALCQSVPGTSIRASLALSNNPLTRRLDQWRLCSPSPWVLRTIAKGYKLQFSTPPPLTPLILYSQSVGETTLILRDEISSLLLKGAIEIVPRGQSTLGFYSKYFVVKKKGGGMRPILDLRGLNVHLRKISFRMLTCESLLKTVRQGDWFTSIDIKDAFLHIPIYPPHRKFLRFAFEGVLYQYTVLPFGLRLSPRTFVKCTMAVLAPLRKRGLRLSTYIDDWLLYGDSPQQVARHTRLVLSHLAALGFTVNMDKSVLVPSQRIDFIGVTLDSRSMSARLSNDRLTSFQSLLSEFQLGRTVTYRMCMRLTGLMASVLALVRLGRIHWRPFQQWVISLGIPSTQGRLPVPITSACMTALAPWRDPRLLTQGVSIGLVVSRKVLTTDACLTGWGATFEGRSASGTWTADLAGEHINLLELMAAFLALQHFEPFLLGHHVLVRTDNMTTRYYLNKQGGLRSHRLDGLARQITLWAHERLLSLTAEYVPGLLNSGADLLSRGEPRYADWSLNPQVALSIWDRYGTPTADLFAAVDNFKLPLYFAIRDPGTLGVDALAHAWPSGLLYAFPPLSLIYHVLERVRLGSHRVLLVAPAWGAWLSVVSPLLYDQPMVLPPRRDLLRQARDEIFHPAPAQLDLWVWPVSGNG